MSRALPAQSVDKAAHPAFEHVRLHSGEWIARARELKQAGATLLGLWASDARDRENAYLVRALFQFDQRALLHECAIEEPTPVFPSIAWLFPQAARMERTLYDLLGLRANDGDHRPWLRHASWPDGFPLRRDFDAAAHIATSQEHYQFIPVEGDGVHEIGVGPVHAGVIEPGHFRFSVVGEKVLRLEERLGYVHKGIEKRFEQLTLAQGQRLAARVSGDSAVAYSWAYCAALEMICRTSPPPRALYLRALALERERLANHLGDLGALGNDAGFTVGLAQFGRLKEDVLRLNKGLFDARYQMEEVIPGGVAHDLRTEAVDLLLQQHALLGREITTLRQIYDSHAGLQDRFMRAGRVEPDLAAQLGLTGLAGRASAQARDLRVDIPWAPYHELGVRMAVEAQGDDVAARVTVRFDEALESTRLCKAILENLPSGPVLIELAAPPAESFGLGLIEAWRGPLFVALESGPQGTIRRCHPHDPSWANWPVIEHAVIDNIVPDFPLINKSFNLSYSGHDL